MENCQSYTAVSERIQAWNRELSTDISIATRLKNFRKIIYRQLYDYHQNNSPLNTYQSGFRSMHSTLTALLETTNNWSINIDNGLLNGVLFIDLKKAFGTINHEIILRKLASHGVDQSALRFCASYLRNRSQKCSVKGALSSASKLTSGVPQWHWDLCSL